jgi:hypothetical protein
MIAFNLVFVPAVGSSCKSYRFFVKQLIFDDGGEAETLELINPSLCNVSALSHIKNSVAVMVWKELGEIFSNYEIRAIVSLTESLTIYREMFGNGISDHALTRRVFECSPDDYLVSVNDPLSRNSMQVASGGFYDQVIAAPRSDFAASRQGQSAGSQSVASQAQSMHHSLSLPPVYLPSQQTHFAGQYLATGQYQHYTGQMQAVFPVQANNIYLQSTTKAVYSVAESSHAAQGTTAIGYAAVNSNTGRRRRGRPPAANKLGNYQYKDQTAPSESCPESPTASLLHELSTLPSFDAAGFSLLFDLENDPAPTSNDGPTFSESTEEVSIHSAPGFSTPTAFRQGQSSGNTPEKRKAFTFDEPNPPRSMSGGRRVQASLSVWPDQADTDDEVLQMLHGGCEPLQMLHGGCEPL